MNETTTTKQKIAILYARVSDVKQAEKGLSIDNQLEQGRKKAESLGAVVLREFVDDGVSGRTDKRPAFQQAIEYCELMSPDYLILWSTSRFFRNKLLAATYKAQLEKIGVEWVYTSIDLSGNDDAAWMAEGFFEMFDEYASRVNSSATKASMIKNAREGHFNGGVVPFGYQSLPDPDYQHRKKLFPHPDEVPMVEYIFSLKLDDEMGARTIAQYLNDQGKTCRGSKWTKTRIANLLKSHSVIGQTIFNRKNRQTGGIRPRAEWIVVDSHDPVIDRDIWERTQSTLSDQANNCQFDSRRSPLVFSNILKCGKCGSSITVESAKGRVKRYHYYVCKAARYEKAHTPDRYPATDMDAWLLETICEEVFNAENLSEIIREIKLRASGWDSNIKKERKQINSQINRINKRLHNLYDVLELHGRDAPNLKDISERIPELKAQRDKAEQRLAELARAEAPRLSASLDDIQAMQGFIYEIIQSAPPLKIKKFLRTFVNRIKLTESEVNIEYDPAKLVQNTNPVRQTRNWLPGAGSNHRQGD